MKVAHDRSQEWKVQFMVPEAEMSELAKYLSGAWMTSGADALPGSPMQVGSLMETAMRFLYNGLPIDGKLRVSRKGLAFIPDESFLQDLFYKNRPSVHIPRKDIVSARAMASFMGMTLSLRQPMVVVTTKNGKLYVRNRAFLGRNTPLAESINSIL
jgi:hypothetical protein